MPESTNRQPSQHLSAFVLGIFTSAKILATIVRISFPQFLLDLYNHPKGKKAALIGFYFFHKPCLIIRDPELIKRIVVKDFPQFMNRRMASDPKSDPIGSNSLLAAKGEIWKSVRSSLSPVFTTRKLKNFFTLISDSCKGLEAKLTKDIPARGSAEINTRELAGFYTLETIATSAFGVTTEALTNPNSDFVRKIREIVNPSSFMRVLEFGACCFFPELAKLFKLRFLSKETEDFFRTTISDVMAERVKSGIVRNDLIDIFNAMKKSQKEVFHNDLLLGQAATFLVAGFDTSSSALSFALYELAGHQDVQEKLRRELEDFRDSGKEMNIENFNNLQYLHMVFQETLRLYPSSPALTRVYEPTNGSNSYSLPPPYNFSIPQGTVIYIPAIAIQRDPNFFPEPLSFRPERFAANAEPPIDPWHFLSFGQGPRNCIGLRFAALQVKMGLLTILLKYRVSFCKRTPKQIRFKRMTFLLYPEDPIFLTFQEI
ncbi:probable cytochrome P450 6g2 [Phlebotomus argentipes]|uniref:probable cytochrome P450 6g2 n=1 Tax=Phlebotomus argentipes TaxID=94469 RepID=UPI002892DDD6|nr:probable cytochrome P450 6g2 [Phlebotomus argentipes]